MNLTSTSFLPAVSILILAGGRATRMNGVDKGLQQINGQTLVQRLLDQLQDTSDDILINANRSLTEYHTLFPAVRIIPDEWQDFRGPLAGIYSGLKQAKHDHVLVIPCDLFILPANALNRMLNILIAQQLSVVYAQINSQPIYPFCLVHKSTLPSLEKQINTQHYAIRHWLLAQHAGTVEFDMDKNLPLNLNTVEQLAQAAQLFINDHPDQLKQQGVL